MPDVEEPVPQAGEGNWKQEPGADPNEGFPPSPPPLPPEPPPLPPEPPSPPS